MTTQASGAGALAGVTEAEYQRLPALIIDPVARQRIGQLPTGTRYYAGRHAAGTGSIAPNCFSALYDLLGRPMPAESARSHH